MTDPTQDAFVAPGGPALAAAGWLSAIVDRVDLLAAWELSHPDLRLGLAQSWVLVDEIDSEERDAVAARVTSGLPSADWDRFCGFRLSRWRAGILRSFVDEGWGLVSIPEYVGVDLCFVRFVVGATEVVPIEATRPLLAQTITTRFDGARWLVGGIGRTVMRPGWPPTEEPLPTDM